MIIAVDFDGTCVQHKYPKVGDTVPGAVPTLKELAAADHKLIIYTMRSGKELDDAIDWYRENNIPFHAVQQEPLQHTWTHSPKCYAEIYIDDAALGCPLIHPGYERPYVDWYAAYEMLETRGAL